MKPSDAKVIQLKKIHNITDETPVKLTDLIVKYSFYFKRWRILVVEIWKWTPELIFNNNNSKKEIKENIEKREIISGKVLYLF